MKREPVEGLDGHRRHDRPDKRVVLRYAALQAPGWMLAALVLFWIKVLIEIPTWALWLVGTAWVGKDIALFPLTWPAYADEGKKGIRDPVGHVGICSDRLAPGGSVRVQGETWGAISEDERARLEAGSTVRITGRDGLVLRVRAESSSIPPEKVIPAGSRGIAPDDG
jgi:membrane protein implicated in regulation of membrane protease activity